MRDFVLRSDAFNLSLHHYAIYLTLRWVLQSIMTIRVTLLFVSQKLATK